MEKQLLYLTSRVFWPTKSGHEVHIYNYCKALHEKYGYEVDVFILDNEEIVKSAAIDKPYFIRNVVCGIQISKLDIINNFISRTVFNKAHWALQTSLYYSKKNVLKLENINNRYKYDVFFVDMIRLAPYIDSFSATPKLCVLDMGDILSKRYERQIALVNNSSNVGGAFTSGMSKGLKKFLSPQWVQKLILRIESKLMQKSEIYWAERYDSVILVSTLETSELNKKLSCPKAVTVRVGVDTEYFKENKPIDKIPGTISFMGDMRTSANSDTVRHIVRDILPLCKNVKKAYFIGKCPENIQEEYKDFETVIFTGMVPDIRSEIKKTNVFIAPMAYGTGVKIKIVEAMAMGIPVVTNAIGAEGIPGENGLHWYVGNTDGEIANYVDLLLVNSAKCVEIGSRAQELVEAKFSWDAATKPFADAGL